MDDGVPPALSGGCLCGRVRYVSGARPGVVANCHCLDCQRQTGSAFSTIAGVSAEAFAVVGETAQFTTRGESGGEVRRHFCGRCGSPVFSDVEATPGLIWVKTGTLDAPAPAPEIQLWWCTAQPWLEALAPLLPRFARNFPAGQKPSAES